MNESRLSELKNLSDELDRR